MIARYRARPLRAALEDTQLRHIVGNGRGDLHGGRTRADYRHALAGQIKRLRPMGGMKKRGGEIVHAVNWRHFRHAYLPHRADQYRRLPDLPFAIFGSRIGCFYAPALRVSLPVHPFDLRVELYLAANVKLIGLAGEIILNFIAWREIAAPAIGFAKAQTIGMIGRIDAAAGVIILPPCAADIGVFLQYQIGDAFIVQQLAHHQTGHTGTDNDNRRGRLRGRCGNCRAQRCKTHLLAHHRRIFIRHILGQTMTHHGQHLRFIRVRGEGWRIAR